MIDELLIRTDAWFIYAALIGLLLLSTEVGVRLGHRVQTSVDEQTRSELTTIQAALLGLLALLLGFSFAMAASRFEARKQLVVDEANAIGTTFLRAQVLPEPHRTEAQNLLRRYVDVRLEVTDARFDVERISEAIDQSERIHDLLWSQAVAVGQKDSHSIITGLFLQTLNETIDLHAKRVAAFRNHVPSSIFLLLCVVAFCSMGVTGYGCGLGKGRNFVPTAAASLLFATVIFTIVDLDRPTQGLITVTHQSLVDLKHSLNRSVP
jgi:hypothetical protein